MGSDAEAEFASRQALDLLQDALEARMPKRLTITVDDDVYDALHRVIGRRRIGRFLNDLARPHVVGQDLSAGYAAMAADAAREAEAETWTEAMLGDGLSA